MGTPEHIDPAPLEAYEQATATVPIASIDVLLWRPGQVGLIHRDYPTGESVWAMVGGGIRRGETLEAAFRRHLEDTLGEDMGVRLPDFDEPAAVGQYLPVERDGYGFDPRKHAIAVSYPARFLSGAITPRNEAHDFGWHEPEELPADVQIWPGQARVIKKLLDRLLNDADFE